MPQVRPLKLMRRYADMIASGTKTVEVRLSSRYTRAIVVGDVVTFDVGKSKLTAAVTEVREFARLSDMLDVIGPNMLGFSSRDEAAETYRRIYPYNADDARPWRTFTLADPAWLT